MAQNKHEVNQGCALLSWLCNLYMDRVMKTLEVYKKSVGADGKYKKEDCAHIVC